MNLPLRTVPRQLPMLMFWLGKYGSVVASPIWGCPGGTFLRLVNLLPTRKLQSALSVPFVFFQRTFVNPTGKEISVNKAVMAEGRVSLGLAADKLSTVSTAGQKAADKGAAGYIYMAVGDPDTRKGVVCGTGQRHCFQHAKEQPTASEIASGLWGSAPIRPSSPGR